MNRTTLFVHDMVHDNPGLVKYQSEYNNPRFLKERGYDGKTFDLFNCAQYGLLWDGLSQKYGRAQIFPKGSKEREWVLYRRAELIKLYQEVVDAGLAVSFMMDIIVLPIALTKVYPEVLNADGKIDIALPITRAIIEELFEEMFSVFPQISGIYIRYGETYTGEKYGEPYHTGNNPILNGEEYHLALINILQEIVCNKHKREIYYRTWGFGDFQYNKETYLRISDNIPVNERFYFCIKHTSGDFHRCSIFNQSLNVGKHNQIVEVQAAREYEGKGAFPNYIADGVINGFEEFSWVMPNENPRCLKDIFSQENSKIKGVWTWSRGGGWDGPYINGRNGRNGEVVVKDGSELWCDLNAYVISHWAKDTTKTEKEYVLQYAKDILNMSQKDSEIFYEICKLSSKAVLLGRANNNPNFDWSVWWTRDQNIHPAIFHHNVKVAMEWDGGEELLAEKRQSVGLWERMIDLSNTLQSGRETEFIQVTCKYGYYLFSLFETMYKANIFALQNKDVKDVLDRYETLWREWEQLRETNSCCPTLYVKEDKNQELIGYDGNRGFDSVMRLR